MIPPTDIDLDVARAGSSALGLRHPVTVVILDDIETKHASDGSEVTGGYAGIQHGHHVVMVKATGKGVKRINTICHELVHARQCEDVLAEGHSFEARYIAERVIHGYHDCPMEVEARHLGARLTQYIAEGIA